MKPTSALKLKLFIHVSIYALVTLNNSLKMIERDRNMTELWGILCKICSFNISASFGFIIGKNTKLGLLIEDVEEKTQSLWNASFSYVIPSVRP